MVAEGRLDAMMMPEPARAEMRRAGIFGFVALTIEVLLAACIFRALLAGVGIEAARGVAAARRVLALRQCSRIGVPLASRGCGVSKDRRSAIESDVDEWKRAGDRTDESAQAPCLAPLPGSRRVGSTGSGGGSKKRGAA
jgi:hypothetical protein